MSIKTFIRHVFSLLGLVLAAQGMSWAAREFPLSSIDLPSGCRIVTGLYPTGIRTAMLYDYKRYAGAMPTLISKGAQSLACGAQRGSLFYFEYASNDDRDQAELFAKPILSREENLPHPIEILEWPKGFIVVSFKNPPLPLMAALSQKLSGGAVVTVASPSMPVAPVAPPAIHFVRASEPVIATTRVAPPSATSVASISTSAPMPIAATSDTSVVSDDSHGLNQMATDRSAAPLSSDPPMDAGHALKATEPAPPRPTMVVKPAVISKPTPAEPAAVNPAYLPKPTSVVPPAPAPPSPVPISVPVTVPPAATTIPSVVSVPAAPVTIPQPSAMTSPVAVAPLSVVPQTQSLPAFAGGHGLEDISDSVLTAFAGKLDCANPDIKEQMRIVCSVLNDFQQGTKPDVPANASSILLGPVYTVDEYGRLTDMHYDVFAGSNLPDHVSFFAVVAGGGREDYEIQSLIDARRNRQALPPSPTLSRIQQTAVKKKVPVVSTMGTSALILPGGPRRLYIRKAGDHWVIVGPLGATSEEQLRSTFVLATLY